MRGPLECDLLLASACQEHQLTFLHYRTFGAPYAVDRYVNIMVYAADVRMILARLLVVAIASQAAPGVQGCYVSHFLQACGPVGERTTIAAVLPPGGRLDTTMNWGDYGVGSGDKFLEFEIFVSDNSTEETLVLLQHVYTEPGQYKLELELLGYRINSDSNNASSYDPCIRFKTIDNYEWILDVQDDSCEEKVNFSMAAPGQVVTNIFVTVFGSALLAFYNF